MDDYARKKVMIANEFVYDGLGFEITLYDVTLTLYGENWRPDINLAELRKNVALYLLDNLDKIDQCHVDLIKRVIIGRVNRKMQADEQERVYSFHVDLQKKALALGDASAGECVGNHSMT